VFRYQDPLITAAQAASDIFDAGGGSVPRILSNSGRLSGAGGSGYPLWCEQAVPNVPVAAVPVLFPS
jgi:hypothetical protein